ncbi:MAG: glycerophosphodiester phosphodiesterase [Vicinamibacteraceae bacterium]|nr:glycerophosphodiester phosphodiesterase [Vicinamibacteraceae bacterium]
MPVRAAGHAAFDSPRPLVFGHRGGLALAPENTLAAFDAGLDAGADGLELDVHLSRDGEVVAIHDATLDRTTNASGAVASFTARELAGVDAGFAFGASDGYPYRGRGVGVPRLADVLERYPGRPLIVELKGEDEALAHEAVALVRAFDAFGHVCLGSFSDRVIDAARRADARVVTSAASREIRWALYRSWARLAPLRPRFFGYQVPETSGLYTIVTPRFVGIMRRVGLPVHVWVVNRADDMRRLLTWGVGGLISDRPDIARAEVGAFLAQRPGAQANGTRAGL